MQLLLLSKFTGKAPGSRYRQIQYIPHLHVLGATVLVSVFLNDNYIDNLYSHNKNHIIIINAYIKRFIALLKKSKKNDVLWIQFEALPLIPFWIESLLIGNVPYVVEYDEPIFHNYDMHPNFIVKKILGDKIDRLMQNATLVIAGNSYIAERAYKAGATKVEIIPTVVDLDKYSVKEDDNISKEFIIGWIGSFSTSKYLNQILNVTQNFTVSGDVKIVAIGASKEILLDPNIQVQEWLEETEVSEIKKFDVGIMPLEDSPWSKGKSGFKLIQYMACGLPVIASPIGANKEIVENGVNGFLADNDDEWMKAIEILRQQPELRHKMGMKGREKVEKMYCLQATIPRLKKILSEAAGKE
jgi:glycosyltransferase involved in cell wall biosynthesis